MQIDFEKLLDNYNKELVTKLRGFNEEHDYMQYWVPDSDKTKSFLNLVDALYEANKNNFSILIIKADEKIKSDLAEISEKIGDIKIEQLEKYYKINFSLDKSKYQNYREKNRSIENKKFNKTKKSSVVNELTEERESYDILSSYEKDLSNYVLQHNKNQNLNNEYEDVFSQFIDNKNKLFVKMEKKTKKILNVWHDFTQRNEKSVMVDKFCKIILKKHIQEAAEHGAIYLEYETRPKDVSKKVKGIILPKTAGNLFFDLNKCIRSIYSDIKKKYNFQDVINKEYFNTSKNWDNLNYDTKMEKLQKVLLEDIIPTLKLNKNDIIIHKIEFSNRIVIKISDELEKKNYGHINYMIEIENLFKNKVDKRLELFTTEKKDDNRLRHLNSPQKI